jgi:hypothetical protein
MEDKKNVPNYWMYSTIVLAIILTVLFIVFYLKPAQVSPDTVGQAVLDLANSQGEIAKLNGVRDMGGFYEVNLSVSGQTLPVYATKDGKYLISSGGLVSLTARANNDQQQQQAQPVQKSDKPIANAYVFSYCPFGLQFEKALKPVYDLLKDKAEINIVYIGAMHGEYEKIESYRQLCIKKIYGTDKFWDYLDKFNANKTIGSCAGKDTCVNPLIEKLFVELFIDKTKIKNCIDNDAQALYDADVTSSGNLGIGGSPTFTVNGGLANNVQRSPEAVKQSICDAFNTPPVECQTALSTTEASSGFGTGAGGGSSSCG